MLGATRNGKVNGITTKPKNKTFLPDVLQMLNTSKWKWAGHAAIAKDSGALDIMKWNLVGNRKEGRPKARWATGLAKYSGDNWAEVAEDGFMVRQEGGLRPAVEQWTTTTMMIIRFRCLSYKLGLRLTF